MSELLVVEDLQKYFPVTRGLVFQKEVGQVKAVDGVSFTLQAGETLGVVGESGCGKSTMARCIARLLEPTGGKINFDGHDITHLGRTEMRPIRRDMMMVFQDPYASLNARKRVGEIVAEPLDVHGVGNDRDRKRRVQELLEIVGLNPEHYNRFPHEFSGGQRQRIGIARALVTKPSVLVADEPVSALDVSVQASILNLLRDLQQQMQFSCLLIAHHLATVEYLCDRALVVHLGQIVESGSATDLFREPQHPYTRALVAAAVAPDPTQRGRRTGRLEGEPPSPLDPPSGCRFRTRCPLEPQSAPRSSQEEPVLREWSPGHRVACHLVVPGRPVPEPAQDAVETGI